MTRNHTGNIPSDYFWYFTGKSAQLTLEIDHAEILDEEAKLYSV